MTIAKAESDRLAKLSQVDKNTSIQNDVDVIHRCVNSGSVDRDTINDALARISACVPKEAAKPAAPATPHTMYGSTQPSTPAAAPKPAVDTAHPGA